MTTPTADAPRDRPTAVYWLFGDRHKLLYVGMSNNPLQRFIEHRDSKSWWPNVTAYSIKWFSTRSHAESAEYAAIRNDGPLHNVEFQPRNEPGGGIVRLPAWVTDELLDIISAFLARHVSSLDLDQRFELLKELVKELTEKIFLFEPSDCPQERHALDIDAVVTALEGFGPLLASMATYAAAPAKTLQSPDNW